MSYYIMLYYCIILYNLILYNITMYYMFMLHVNIVHVVLHVTDVWVHGQVQSGQSSPLPTHVLKSGFGMGPLDGLPGGAWAAPPTEGHVC